MTYKQAIENGYTKGHTAYQRGYISRKTDINTQTVLTGRKGLYVLIPAFNTTIYCIRQYLKKQQENV
ncbi:MAG: hypothetical protein RR490_00430 [Niameybacter sp.]